MMYYVLTPLCPWQRPRGDTCALVLALRCTSLRFTQGYAFVEFVERTEAEQAQLYLDGGQVS